MTREHDIEETATSERASISMLNALITIGEADGGKVNIVLYTLCDGASVEISKTHAKRWLKESWASMLRRYDPLPHFIESATPTMELTLTKWNTLRMYAKIKTVRTEKNQAYLDEAKKAREEIYAKHYNGVDVR